MKQEERAPDRFEFSGGELCLDFANTVDDRTDPDRRRDRLERYPDLLRWARQASTLSAADAARLRRAAEASPGAARRALARALALREAIYQFMSAQAANGSAPAGALETIATAAASAAAHRRIARSGPSQFTWEWPGATPLDRPIWPVAISAGDLVTSDRLPLVRECALETCGWLFLDTSRNRTRRWCDMRVCGNRAKARRFYERNRAGCGNAGAGASATTCRRRAASQIA